MSETNIETLGHSLTEGMRAVTEGVQEFDQSRQTARLIGEQVHEMLAAIAGFDPLGLANQLGLASRGIKDGHSQMLYGAGVVADALQGAEHRAIRSAEGHIAEALGAIGGAGTAGASAADIASRLGLVLTDRIPRTLEALRVQLSAARLFAGQLAMAETTEIAPQVDGHVQAAAQDIQEYGEAIGVDLHVLP